MEAGGLQMGHKDHPVLRPWPTLYCWLGMALALVFAVAGWAQAPANRDHASHHSATPSEPPVVHDGNSPAYHAHPPRGPLPATLSPEQFTDPRVKNAYAMAAKVKRVLYQEPCYCYCDKGYGHHSLLDCYVGNHAAECEVCLMEGIYAYQQTQKGKTPGQIRAAIKRGEWKSVNLNDYLASRAY